ncbi:MAG: sugar phosphate isomerase/epimerase [Opitutales bacterium]|jgi:sugar phosphate isomerase/epimerase|nr:sugar phosphate isomerase/epimerase [Opitutales bacterium]MBT5167546.1 sugar phosphate isomerase/epimerase [Opitutales bacterium]MBT5813773.1 sugar phosphate isomerase/epimerase [Opitutales bacterium]MBT6379400.1 sugar phosphate isomerase/epimerase [Opitutales bacterium]
MMNRRSFVAKTTLTGLAATVASGPLAMAQSRSVKRKMTINLVCGAIGVKASQERAIELAHEYGFESVEAHGPYLSSLGTKEMQSLKKDVRSKNLVWGTSGLTVDFRKDRETFENGLKELPQIASGLRRAGVKRVSTWLRPCHNDLTYNQNFKQHTERLRAVASILGDQGLRFGMEYVGTTTLLVSMKYPFVHTMAEALELANAIGTGNVGIVLDSWHWWQAGDSVADIEKLKNSDIVLVDLNDAPTGVEKQQQMDNRRELPVATGVIEVKGFLDALVKIGYDGPVRAEPFNQPLRNLDDAPACKATVDSIKKAFAMIG